MNNGKGAGKNSAQTLTSQILNRGGQELLFLIFMCFEFCVCLFIC